MCYIFPLGNVWDWVFSKVSMKQVITSNVWSTLSKCGGCKMETVDVLLVMDGDNHQLVTPSLHPCWTYVWKQEEPVALIWIKVNIQPFLFKPIPIDVCWLVDIRQSLKFYSFKAVYMVLSEPGAMLQGAGWGWGHQLASVANPPQPLPWRAIQPSQGCINPGFWASSWIPGFQGWKQRPEASHLRERIQIQSHHVQHLRKAEHLLQVRIVLAVGKSKQGYGQEGSGSKWQSK